MRKGPSFIPNPTEINWFNLKRGFDNFVNKLRYMATKSNDGNKKNTNPKLDSSTLGTLHWKSTSNSEAAKYKLPKGKDRHK